MSSRTILILAAILGGVGIVIGAFGAHSLPRILKDLPEADLLQRKEWLETGARYHMYHAIAMLVIAFASEKGGSFASAAIAWLIGILLFSGCLYVMSVTGIRILGAVVPLGGLAFIVGWVLMLLGALRVSSS